MPSLEILEGFRNEREALVALALLITGNKPNAEGAVGKARKLMTNWAIPFAPPEQLMKWVRWVTIEPAVACSLVEITCYEPRYFNRTCMHAEHLLHGNSKLHQFYEFLVHLNPAIVIAELDPLAKAVAVLRKTSRASILDCALPLKLSADIVLATNCQAMSWIAQKQNEAHGEQVPSPDREYGEFMGTIMLHRRTGGTEHSRPAAYRQLITKSA